jgi:hypothetical protein
MKQNTYSKATTTKNQDLITVDCKVGRIEREYV